MRDIIKFTVIIPFFNSSKYSDDIHNSIPALPEFEIIFVDDKSSKNEADELKRIIANHPNHSVKYYLNARKKSAGTRRNIGLEHANGKWVIFADSDDYFTSDFHEIVNQHYAEEADLIYFTPTSYVRIENTIGTRHIQYCNWVKEYIRNPISERELALKTGFVVPWSKMIKLELIKENNIVFDEARASNDVMFSLKVAFAARKFTCSDECLYCVTKNPGSLMYKVDKEVLDARLEVYVRQYNFLKHELSAQEFSSLTMYGTSMLKRYIFAKQSPIRIVGVFIKLKKNGIKLFNLNKLRIRSLKKTIHNIKKNEFYNQ